MQLSEKRGFGESRPAETDYGTKPDELYPNVRAAFERVVALFLPGGRSEPPTAVRLAELRQGLGLSQAELAERAGIKQAHVSRIEDRDDVLVSTLAKLLAGMGAELTIRAHFPGTSQRDVEIKIPAAGGELEQPR